VNAANLIAALPLCSLSSNTHSVALRIGEANLVTYYEDPRRFSSRVIGLSFQGPRGRTFLPSGSRCLVCLVFAVKDFLRLSFHRCFGLFSLSFDRASRLRSGSRCLVCLVFPVKGFSKLSFHRGSRRIFSPAFLRAWKVRSGSRYLVFVVFAVKDFVNFLLRPPGSSSPLRGGLSRGRSALVGSESGGGVCSRSGSLGK
jgi:hypothetical protein